MTSSQGAAAADRSLEPLTGDPSLRSAPSPRRSRDGGKALRLKPLEAEARAPRSLALAVHQHLRRLILDGTLEAGTVLNQAEYARALDVSRTPTREAFRMLQEEGLIHAEPDRRAVVVGVDLSDLNAVYGSRIMLESLAVSLTVSACSPALVRAMEDALQRMRELREERLTSPAWKRAHDEFHRLATGGADAQILRLLATVRERTHSYLRLAQSSSDVSWQEAERHHTAILEAFRNRDAKAAVASMALHLEATALRVVCDANPGRDLPAVRNALALLGVPASRSRRAKP
jgi:DNA-binding GntR family transcriptional regulator